MSRKNAGNPLRKSYLTRRSASMAEQNIAQGLQMTVPQVIFNTLERKETHAL